MAVIKPAFMRPVEITTSNNSCEMKLYDVGLAGVKTAAVSIDTGVYGSIFNVAGSIAAAITAEFTDWTVTASFVVGAGAKSDDLLIRFSFVDNESSGTDPETEWDELYDLIGSQGSVYLTAETITENPQHTYTQTMSYRPSHMWIPIYQTAEQGRFYIEQSEIFSGNMSRSGFLSGNQTGPVIYWRDLSFVNETAENVYISASTHTRKNTRNLETFVKGCRSVNISDTGNPSARGFYFFPDWTNLQTTCSNLTSDNGGINFDHATSPDTYAFCQMNTRGYSVPQSSLPTTRTRYSTAFQIHTVDYTVSWTYQS